MYDLLLTCYHSKMEWRLEEEEEEEEMVDKLFFMCVIVYGFVTTAYPNMLKLIIVAF